MKQAILEFIVLILVLNFFYEGIYKIANWHQFAIWLKHAPLLKSLWVPLTYIIPIMEIAFAVCLLSPKYRIQTLYLIILSSIIYIIWIACGKVFSSKLFWPYHALWKNPTWMQKAVISVGCCWLSFLAIILPTTDLSDLSKLFHGKTKQLH